MPSLRIPTQQFPCQVLATSFADPEDVKAFRRAKLKGMSDLEAMRRGDNGIGAWGDDTTGARMGCALPPETLIEWFGSVALGRYAFVCIEANGHTALAEVLDLMPHRRNIGNGAGIDLNPATAAALGLKPPFGVLANIYPCPKATV